MPESQLTKWQLARDGDVITTPRGQLYPVRLPDGDAAMVKVSTDAEERDAHLLLRWRDGDGAARVLPHEGPALLMERAVPGKPPIALSPLLEQCRSLEATALEAQIDVRPLHGDPHHDNVPDFGARGWLAIDPKRVHGDRAFDYTVLFTNPDSCGPGTHVATVEAVFERRLRQVCGLAGLDRPRLLRWIAASAGLSAVWFLADGDAAEVDLAVAGHGRKAAGRVSG